MDNEALMRRIAAASEAQKRRLEQQKAQEQKPAGLPPGVRTLPTGTAREEPPSHLASIVQKPNPLTDPPPQAGNGVTAPRPHQQAASMPSAAVSPQIAQPMASAQAPSATPPQYTPPPHNIAATPQEAAPLHPEQPAEEPIPAPMPQPAGGTMPPPIASPESDLPGLASGDETIVGTLIECDGANATVFCPDAAAISATGMSVGQMLVMENGDRQTVALVYNLTRCVAADSTPEAGMIVKLELQGEIRIGGESQYAFRKGLTSYPPIGTNARTISPEELSALYAASGNTVIDVGVLAQEASITAHIDVEEMLSKHFAVLGATGSGKSSAVSLLMRLAQESVPDLRTMVLDPHNEYACAFPEAIVVDQDSLDLPFWLLQLEEYVEVLARGRSIAPEEVDALREFIPEAKKRFRESEERTSLRADTLIQALTADTPVPYRISDVLALIDEEIGLLEARFDRATLKCLRGRIVAHANDPRYRFMFRDKTISDKAEEVISRLFRLGLPTGGMTILQMSGMPAEVVNAIASLLCRLAFELCIAARGRLKVLTVCEEAHRYVPADASRGFNPTRLAIARIAKEGRKYGSFLGIISQRPAELDATILSQCSSVFTLRLTNSYDQDLIRRAIPNTSASTISFLSSLANREAIAFGEAVVTPMRLRFRNMPREWLPGRDRSVFDPANRLAGATDPRGIFRAWRGTGLPDPMARPGEPAIQQPPMAAPFPG